MSLTDRAKRFEIIKENRVRALLNCHECVEIGDDILIAHELFAGMPLSLYLAREWNFGEREVQEIILQILVALESIHARSIIHGRLMLENVLYDHKVGDVRLIGFLHIYEGGNWGAERRRIDRYLAPEFFMFNEYSYSSEMYSVAIMMMELLTGKRWLENLSDDNVVTYQISKGFKFPKVLSSEVSRNIRYILERALEVDAKGRFETIGDMRQAFYAVVGGTIFCDVTHESAKEEVQIAEKIPDHEDKGPSPSSTLIPVVENYSSPELSSSIRLTRIGSNYHELSVPRWRQLLYAGIAITLIVFVLNDLGVRGNRQKFEVILNNVVQAVTVFFNDSGS
jgi:serine/threonine protein kinase